MHYIVELVSRRGCVCVIQIQQWLDLYYVLELERLLSVLCPDNG